MVIEFKEKIGKKFEINGIKVEAIFEESKIEIDNLLKKYESNDKELLIKLAAIDSIMKALKQCVLDSHGADKIIELLEANEIEGFEPNEDEPKFALELDSICYGCKYFVGEDEDCTTPKPCIGGNMNGYRMDG
jgi:hypothetical protein